jgi:hypothetical protein
MMSVCKQIFVLDFGKVIASGSPQQVQADPAVTAAYLGAEGTGETGEAQETWATGETEETSREETAGPAGGAEEEAGDD